MSRFVRGMLALSVATSAVLVGVPLAGPAAAAPTTWVASTAFPNQPVQLSDSGVVQDFVIDPVTGVQWRGTPANYAGLADRSNVAADWSAHRVYATNPGSSAVSVYDASSAPASIPTASSTIALPSSVGWGRMVADEARHRLYILNRSEGALYSYDTAAATLAKVLLPSGSNPFDLLYDAGNDRIVVTAPGAANSSAAGSVISVDAAGITSAAGTQTPSTSTATVGVQPRGITLDPGRGQYFVANEAAGTLSVVSAVQLAVTRTIDLRAGGATGADPLAVLADPAKSLVWVAGRHNGLAAVQLAAADAVFVVNDDNGTVYAGPTIQLQDSTRLRLHPLSGFPVENRFNGTPTGFYSQADVLRVSERVIVTTTSLPDMTMGQSASGQLAATGQKPDFGRAASHQWSTLDSGFSSLALTLNATGGWSGTPTSTSVWGARTVSVQALGDAGSAGAGQRSVSFYVIPPAPSISTTSLANGSVGVGYSQQISATYVNSAYGDTWALRPGDQLPPGLALNQNGTITGTPTAAGTYSFRVVATNNIARTAQTAVKDLSITTTVSPPVIEPTMTWQSGQDPLDGEQQYAFMWMQLASGSPSATWSMSAGALPGGLTLDTSSPGNERITGAVTDPVGTAFSFTVRATNSTSGLFDQKTFSGSIQPAPPIANFGNTIPAWVGVPFSWTPTPTGTQPVTWSTNGNEPSWVSVATSGGTIAGTAPNGTAPGTSGWAQTAENAATQASGNPVTDYPGVQLSAAPGTTQSVTITAGQTLAQPLTKDPSYNTGFPGFRLPTGAVVPSWLTVDGGMGNNTGDLGGAVPANAPGATYVFVVQYYDGNYNDIGTVVTLTVVPAPPVLAASTSVTTLAGSTSTYQFVPTGGGAPTSWALNGAPSGVTVSANGLVSIGSGTAAGTYTFTATATNAGGTSNTTTVSLTVASTPVIPSTATAYWRVGQSNTYTLTPSAGAQPFTVAIQSGSLPGQWSASTGNGTSAVTLTGTPSTVSTQTVTLRVANSAGHADQVLTIEAGVAPTYPASLTIPTPGVGMPYSHTPTAPSTGTGPFTWTVATGSLPAGLSLNTTTGAVTGTPTTAGAAGFTLQVANSWGQAATSVATNVAVVAPVYTSPISRFVQTGAPVTVSPTRTGGSPATSWAVSAGSLPGWLTQGSNGDLTGTAPGSATTATFSVTGTNSSGTATIPVTLTVQALPGLPGSTTPPAAVVGVPYSYTFSPTGTGPFAWSTTGTLPAGLTFSNGVISGTPTAAGSASSFAVTVNNGLSSQNSSGSASTSVALSASVVAPTAAATGTASSANLAAVSYTFAQSGGSPATSWSATGLPAGVTFANGVMSGTPTVSGTFTVVLTGTNSAGSASQTVTYSVTGPPVLPTTTTTPAFTAGLQGTYQLAPGGSPSATSYSTSGLPSWITVNPTTGLVTATPPVGTASPYTFPVTVSNGVGSPVTTTVSIPVAVVAPTLAATTTVPQIGPGAVSTYTVAPTGGTPGTYTLASSPVPPSWVSINSVTGQLTFTNPPVAAIGSHTFGVVSTNSAGTASTSVTVTVADVPIVPAAVTYVVATGSSWTKDLSTEITSGPGPYTWSRTAGSYPSWVGLSGSTLSGTAPSSASTPAPFTMAVANGNGSSTVVVTIQVVVAPAFTGAVTPPAAATGVPYSYTPPIVTGTGPFTWAITPANALPNGLTINPSTGVVSGTPTGPGGGTSFTVSVTNALGAGSAATSGSTSITATTVTPTVTSPQAVSITSTAPASTQFATTGGSPATSWTATGLPSGLSLSSSGQLVGTVAGSVTAGTYPVTITPSNSGGSAPVTVNLTVVTPPVAVGAVTAPTAATGSPYSYTLPVTGGGGPYTYAVTGGSLPTWATLNPSTGAITGTPPAAGGPTTVTVSVTNAAGTTPVTVSLSSAVTTTYPTAPSLTAVANQPVTLALAPSGTGPFSYAVTAGSLPSWATLNTSTGVITGTPTAAGSGSFTVTATGAVGSAPVVIPWSVTVAAPVLGGATTRYATEGMPFTWTPVPIGGSAVASWSASAGSLPTGLTVNSITGVVSGTPAAGTSAGSGTTTVTLAATNSGGTGTQAVTVVVLTAPSLPPTTTPPAARVGTSFVAPVTATGTGTFTYAVTGGQLPAGLTINPATGAISGTPTQATSGPVTVTVTATNQAGTTVSTQVVLSVQANGTPTIGLTAPNGQVVLGQPFTSPTPSTNNLGPVTWSIGGGSLPAGLTLNPQTGVVSGTPTGIGQSQWTLVATSGNQSASATMSLRVVAAGPAPNLTSSLRIQIAVGQVAVGAPVTAQATGLLPGAPWSIWMHSSPVLVASGTTPADGRVSLTENLPSSIEVGAHRVYLEGTGVDGSPVVAQAWLAVTESGRMTAVSYRGPVAAPASVAGVGPRIGAPVAAVPAGSTVPTTASPSATPSATTAPSSAAPSAAPSPGSNNPGVGPVAAPSVDDGVPTWLLALAGVAGAALLALLGLLFLAARRRRAEEQA